MSVCNNCNTKFRFTDSLKAMNPARIKCTGCSSCIESSYVALFIALAAFILLCIVFWFLPYSGGSVTSIQMIIFLAILGGIFEYGYYYLLSNGVIKSNLIKPK